MNYLKDTATRHQSWFVVRHELLQIHLTFRPAHPKQEHKLKNNPKIRHEGLRMCFSTIKKTLRDKVR